MISRSERLVFGIALLISNRITLYKNRRSNEAMSDEKLSPLIVRLLLPFIVTILRALVLM